MTGQVLLNDKEAVLENLVERIRLEQERQTILFKRYKLIGTASDICVSTLTAATTSSLFISFQIPAMLTLSACLSSAALIVSTANTSLKSSTKADKHLVASQQYSSLLRDVQMRVLENHFNSEELTELLHEVDHRIQMIQDSVPGTWL